MSLTREEKDIWKEQVEESRHTDFNILKIWLKGKGVTFTEKTNGIIIKDIFITDLLKVYFDGTRKGYQYNLDGIKKRLVKSLGI